MILRVSANLRNTAHLVRLSRSNLRHHEKQDNFVRRGVDIMVSLESARGDELIYVVIDRRCLSRFVTKTRIIGAYNTSAHI